MKGSQKKSCFACEEIYFSPNNDYNARMMLIKSTHDNTLRLSRCSSLRERHTEAEKQKVSQKDQEYQMSIKTILSSTIFLLL